MKLKKERKYIYLQLAKEFEEYNFEESYEIRARSRAYWGFCYAFDCYNWDILTSNFPELDFIPLPEVEVVWSNTKEGKDLRATLLSLCTNLIDKPL